MELTHEASFDAPVDRVLAVLTDHAFLLAYAAALGSAVDSAEASPTGTRLVATLQVTKVPKVFAPIVGSAVTVDDRRTYDGSTGTLDVRAGARGRNVRASGTLEVAAAGDGSLLRTRADVSARVPLIGERVEAAVVGLLRANVLERQATAIRSLL